MLREIGLVDAAVGAAPKGYPVGSKMDQPPRTPLKTEIMWFVGVTVVVGGSAIAGFWWFLSELRRL